MSTAAALRLSATLIGGGTAHFLAPAWFDALIPPQLPGDPRHYTVASGVANLAVGVGLAVPQTRKPASLAAAVLFVAYMPAKVKLTVDWWRDEDKSTPAKVAGVVQLFWQIPLVTESLRVYSQGFRSTPPYS